MKISRLRIRNFRSFSDATIDFEDYTCLVGPNGAGKSTVLAALNIFFREGQSASEIEPQDFHHRNTSEPIEIVVTFSDLSEEAKIDFADYYRQGELSIASVASFDATTGAISVTQCGQRLVMADFAPFFAAANNNAKVGELKDIYNSVRESFSSLPPPGSKDSMTEALRAYEELHTEDCVLMPSEDQFYGLSKGANRLAKYVQWIYVPAVKDVSVSENSEERNSALSKLLLRTVRSQVNFAQDVSDLRNFVREKYQALLSEKEGALESISNSLQKRLLKWAHPGASLRITWTDSSDKTVKIEEPLAKIVAGEGIFTGDLSRFGHGLQRSYLLALLEELASTNDTESPMLILGCEEPELYQHPPQARHLAHVLRELSNGNAQVIVSTHSQLFVSGEVFQSVRMVRKQRETGVSIVKSASPETVGARLSECRGKRPLSLDASLAKIHQELQPSISEMFFTSRLVLVEGIEDLAYITTYLHLLNLWEKYRGVGCHIVPVNGKGHILQPLIVADVLEIPTLVIFDSDADRPDNGRGSRASHEADNKAILKQLDMSNENPMPDTTLWADRVILWSSELTKIVASEIADWEKSNSAALTFFGHPGDLEKNGLFISYCLHESAKNGNMSSSLSKACEAIISFGSRDF